MAIATPRSTTGSLWPTNFQWTTDETTSGSMGTCHCNPWNNGHLPLRAATHWCSPDKALHCVSCLVPVYCQTVPVRSVDLTVKQTFAITRSDLSYKDRSLPLRASVTFLQATTPVKLPNTYPQLRWRNVIDRSQSGGHRLTGRYFIIALTTQ